MQIEDKLYKVYVDSSYDIKELKRYIKQETDYTTYNKLEGEVSGEKANILVDRWLREGRQVFKNQTSNEVDKYLKKSELINSGYSVGYGSKIFGNDMSEVCEDYLNKKDDDKKYYMFLEHRGYIGSVNFKDADGVFCGKIEDIKDLVSFEGFTEEGVRQNFINAVNDYLSDIDNEAERQIKKADLIKSCIFKDYGVGDEVELDSWDTVEDQLKNSTEDIIRTALEKGYILQDVIKEVGRKDNNTKLPMSILFKQFPRALQAVVLASSYGHNKYIESDSDYLNFSRVSGGSKAYHDADIRHQLDKEIYGENDIESGLPHIFHEAFDKLAKCELWIKENDIDIKEFSKNYLEKLQDKK